MSSPTFRFSQDTFQFFGENQDNRSFILPPPDVEEAENPVGAMFTVEGSGTQFRALPDGRMEVSLISVLDDDKEIETGRIFRKDIFIVDQEGKVDHQRKFDFNGQGTDQDKQLWEKRNQSFQKNFQPKEEVLNAYKRFVAEKIYPLATDYSQVYDEAYFEQWKTLSEAQKSFWSGASQQLQEQSNQTLGFKSKDESSTFSLKYVDGQIQILFRLGIAGSDGVPVAFLDDQFVINPQDLKVVSHQRQWLPVENKKNDTELNTILQALNEKAAQSGDTAKDFLNGMLPYLVQTRGPFFAAYKNAEPTGGKAVGGDNLWDQVNLPKPKAVPLSLEAKERQEDAKLRAERAQPVTYNPLAHPIEPTFTEKQKRDGAKELSHGVALLGMATLEKIYQDVDSSQGYLNKVFGDKPMDAGAEVQALNTVLEATQKAWEKNPKQSLMLVLKSLQFEGMAEVRRQEMIKDPVVLQVSAIEENWDTETRAKDYMVMIRSNLLAGANRSMTARYLSEQVEFHLAPQDGKAKQEAHQVQAFFNGKADMGTAMELQLPTFIDHVVTPETLVAMYAGGLVGGHVEAIVGKSLKGVSLLAPMVRARSFVGATSGLVVESAAFSGSHMLASTLRHNPEQILNFDRFKTETKSMILLLGATRVFHGMASRFPLLGERALIKRGWLIKKPKAPSALRARLEGHEKFGKVWESILPSRTPTQAVLTDPLGRAIGGPAPELNAFGKTITGTLNHSAGIGAMHTVMTHKDELGVRLPDEPVHPPTVVDSAQGYFAAVLGFQAANGMSRGRLQARIAELKFNNELLKTAPLDLTALSSSRIPPPPASGKTVVDPLSMPGVPESKAPETPAPKAVRTPPKPGKKVEVIEEIADGDFEILPDSDPKTQVDPLAPTQTPLSLAKGKQGPQTMPDPVAPDTDPTGPDTAQSSQVKPESGESMFGKAAKSPPMVDHGKSADDSTQISAQPVSPDSRPAPLPEAKGIEGVKPESLAKLKPEDLSTWDRFIDRIFLGGKMLRLNEQGAEGQTLLERLSDGFNELLGLNKELRDGAEQWERYGTTKRKESKRLRSEKADVEMAKEVMETELKAELNKEEAAKLAAEGELAKALENVQDLENRVAELKYSKDTALVEAGDAIKARDQLASQITELARRNSDLQDLVIEANTAIANLRKAGVEGLSEGSQDFAEVMGRLKGVLTKVEQGKKSLEEDLIGQSKEMHDIQALLKEKDKELAGLREDLLNAHEVQGAAERGKKAAEAKVEKIKEAIGEYIPEVKLDEMEPLDAVEALKTLAKESASHFANAEAQLQQLQRDLGDAHEALNRTHQALEQTKEESAAQLQATASELQSAQGALKNTKRAFETEQQRANGLENLHEVNKKRIAEQQEQIADLTQRLRSAAQNKVATEKDKKGAQERVMDLETELGEKQGELQLLQQAHQEKIGELDGQISALRHQVSELGIELKAAKADLELQTESAKTAEKEVQTLKAELAQKDTQVAAEVLQHNKLQLDQQVPPADFSVKGSLNFAIENAATMVGTLTLSTEGRVIKLDLSPANLKASEGPVTALPRTQESGQVAVVKVGETVLWHSSNAHLNGKQKTALKDLSADAAKIKHGDPYTHQALAGEGLGPLAIDLAFVLPDAMKTLTDRGDTYLKLVEVDGRLRIYHESANADFAFKAKSFLKKNADKSLGTIKLELSEFQEPMNHARIWNASATPKLMKVTYKGEAFKNWEGFESMMRYFGAEHAARIIVQRETADSQAPGKPSIPPPSSKDLEPPTIVPPPADIRLSRESDPESGRRTMPHIPKPSPLPKEAIKELPPLKAIQPTPHLPKVSGNTQEGLAVNLPKAEIRMGEMSEGKVPSLVERILEFGRVEGTTYEGVGYRGKGNQDGFARIIDANGNLVLVSVDGAGGNGCPKEAAEIILKTLAAELPKNPDIGAAVQKAGKRIQALYDAKVQEDPSRAEDEFFDPNAALEISRINLPEGPGKPYTFQSFKAGDSSTILSRQVQGRHREVWSSKEETIATQMIDFLNPELYRSNYGDMPREMAEKTHPQAYAPTNSLGKDGAKEGLRGTEEGRINPDLVKWVTLKDGSKAIVMEVGDVVTMGSDGLMENYGTKQQLLAVTDSALPGDTLADPHLRGNFAKQALLQSVQGIITNRVQEIRSHAEQLVGPFTPEANFTIDGIEYRAQRWEQGSLTRVHVKPVNPAVDTLEDALRVPVQWGNQLLYMNVQGRIYDSATGGRLIDLAKTDNFNMLGFELNPETLKTTSLPKMDAPGTFQAPPARHPSSTPADTPQSKRHGPPSKPGQETEDVHERKTVMFDTMGEADRDTTALRILQPGQVLPLKSNLSGDHAPEATLYHMENGGWRIKMLAESGEIRIESEFDKSNIRPNYFGGPEISGEPITKVAKTLNKRGDEFTLPWGKHIIRVGEQEYMVVTQKVGEDAQFFAKDLDQATSPEDPIPLTNGHVTKPEGIKRPQGAPARRPSPPPMFPIYESPVPPSPQAKRSPVPPFPSPLPPSRSPVPPPPRKPRIVIPGVDTPAAGPAENKIGSGILPPPNLPPKRPGGTGKSPLPPRTPLAQTVIQDRKASPPPAPGRRVSPPPLPPQKRKAPPLPARELPKLVPPVVPTQKSVSAKGVEVENVYEGSGDQKTLQYHQMIWRTAQRIVFGRAGAAGDQGLGLVATDMTSWRFHLDKASAARKILGGLADGVQDYAVLTRPDPTSKNLILENRGKLEVKVLLPNAAGKEVPHTLPKMTKVQLPANFDKKIQIGNFPPFIITFE